MNERHPDLPRLLHGAADDIDPTIPDLRPRARANRRRRIAVTAGLTTAVLGATGWGAAALIQNLPRQQAHPAAPPASSPATPPTPAIEALDPATIVSRCLTQLEAYEQYPMYADAPASDWTVAHPHSYVEGDIVMLVADATSPRYCVIPQADGVPVDPIEYLRPSMAEPDRVAALCSESQRLVTNRDEMFSDNARPEFAYGTPDLRDATVALGDEVDGIVAAVLAHEDRTYTCTAIPLDHDLDNTILTPEEATPSLADFSPFRAMLATGEGGKSIVEGDRVYYVGAGLTPDGVASIRVTGQVEGTVPVVDGQYATVLRGISDGAGVTSATYELLDADGAVLATGTTDSGR